ncbi:MAG TPA: asparagine synthase-related protein, partial [Gemmatimonadales bacterium]
YSPGTGLKVGGDIMGMYPLYYWREDAVTLVGSSAALFPRHPAFRFELDRAGLAGVLTTNGLVAHRSIYRDVRRMPGGVLLDVPTDGPTLERVQFRFPESDRYYDLSFSQHIRILFETVADVMQRHVPPARETGLLLSGGLDSRTLAGFLARQGTPTVACTMGWPGDYDARCAGLVARELRMENHLWPDQPAAAESFARVKSRWEHLSNGFHWEAPWQLAGQLAETPSRVVAGFAFDMLLAPIVGAAQHLDSDLSSAFEGSFPRANGWGFPPEMVGRLLGDSRLAAQVLEDLRSDFVSRSRLAGRAASQFVLGNRARYHLGGMVWPMSFGSWPVLPVLDRALQGVIGGIPLASLIERRAQSELVRTHFPRLARIPLDRFSGRPFPLDPSLADQVRQGLSRRWERLMVALPRHRGPERRHHFRTADLNGPSWRAIRREAEKSRLAATDHIDRELLDHFLPGPDQEVRVANVIKDSAKLKLLLGFMLWVGNRGDQDSPTILDD